MGTNTINSFIKLFTEDTLDYELIKNKYYFIPEQLRPHLKKLENYDLYSAGFFLGEQKKFFEPSIYLLEWLSPKTKRKIFVNDKAEWLFLCKRDVLKQGLLNNNKNFVGDGLVLVQNERDENLGLGSIQKDGTINNVVDRGDFLRRER